MFEWHHRFKYGCELLEGNPCNGQPATLQNKDSVMQVQGIVYYDHYHMMETVAENIRISVGRWSCHPQ